MTTAMVEIESQHEDMIHDCQFDYYAKKLATCSSDRTIKIFDVTGDIYYNSSTLQGHEGPIWQVSWAHPKFGVLLASCSYDGSVLIHREAAPNNWVKAYEHNFHNSSVNSISWAPHEYGLILACASSDGKVSILEHKNNQWSMSYFQNDGLGCNSVSWAPYGAAPSSSSEQGSQPFLGPQKRLVTGSCDNKVRIWSETGAPGDGSAAGVWTEESLGLPHPHSDWVRDVAWAPNASSPMSIIASCSEDRSVFIWRQDSKGRAGAAWEAMLLFKFDAPVWRVSWSVTGNVLAVSSGDHKVTLWKQAVDETWAQISTVEDSPATN